MIAIWLSARDASQLFLNDVMVSADEAEVGSKESRNKIIWRETAPFSDSPPACKKTSRIMLSLTNKYINTRIRAHEPRLF